MLPAGPFILSADAVLPMDAALPAVLHRAGVVISGERITAVGRLDELRAEHEDLPTRHHAGVLLPGFVNAHTHLELSYLSAAALKAADFPHWVANLIASYPPADKLEATIRQSFRKGLDQSFRAGVTTIGDVSRHVAITRDELVHSPRIGGLPRIVSFGEIVGLGKMRRRVNELLDAATQPPLHPVTPLPYHLIAGISPHAPYTIEGPALRACVRRAIIKRVPICMHLAELPDEAAFLRDLSGPLGREWDVMLKIDILDDEIPLFKGGPIRWAQQWGLLICDPQNPPPRRLPVLLAHVNYVDHAEMMQLATAAGVSVAYCPRTHAYFGHRPHQYRDMLDCGINVCLATDSLASNPDLSVLKEAQFVYQQQRQAGDKAMEPVAILEMITRRGARALGLEKQVGTLAVGKYADCLVLPVEVGVTGTAGNLCEKILKAAPEPAVVYVGGESVESSRIKMDSDNVKR